jgi:hypothetical protein
MKYNSRPLRHFEILERHNRADEKHNPEYYARHTVEKARAALDSTRRDVQSQPEASGHSAPVRE